MKEFIFDEYQHCINPNRIEFGNKEFYGEIQTAFCNGKWYCGDFYWTRGNKWEQEPSLNTNEYDTEREAILSEIEHLIKHLTWIQEAPFNTAVPDFIFKQLKDLQVNTKNPQLVIF